MQTARTNAGRRESRSRSACGDCVTHHAAIPLMEVLHAVFHGALVGSDLVVAALVQRPAAGDNEVGPDRKSTRLNSSHSQISYAVFCLKKKNKHNQLN